MKYCITLHGVSYRHSEDNIYCDNLEDIPSKIADFVSYIDHIEIEGYNEEGYDYDELEYTFGGFSVREVKDVEVDEKQIINELGSLLVKEAKKENERRLDQKKRKDLDQLKRLKEKYE